MQFYLGNQKQYFQTQTHWIIRQARTFTENGPWLRKMMKIKRDLDNIKPDKDMLDKLIYIASALLLQATNVSNRLMGNNTDYNCYQQPWKLGECITKYHAGSSHQLMLMILNDFVNVKLTDEKHKAEITKIIKETKRKLNKFEKNMSTMSAIMTKETKKIMLDLFIACLEVNTTLLCNINDLIKRNHLYKSVIISGGGGSVAMDQLNQTQREVSEWLDTQLRYNNVPRVVDVQAHVLRHKLPLTRKQVAQVVRLHPQYRMNMPQQRQVGRSRLYRPVVVSELGHWHADIGFYPVNKRYEMPITYRAGFLVAKDILSRRVYATPLLKNRTADSIISAFNKLFANHNQQYPNTPIRSIAFDQETSVMSKKVQSFFSTKGIKFHPFKMSSSKAKFAEGAIRQIKQANARLMERGLKKDRWWNLLPHIVDGLNNQPIVVDNKPLGFTPNQITESNVGKFRKKLFKAVPAYYIAQFDLAPNLMTFAFQIGNVVRAKLIATSSDVLGNKRSEINVTQQVFVIEEKVPYVTRKMTVGKAYKCRSLLTNEVEIFQEDEIALTSE